MNDFSTVFISHRSYDREKAKLLRNYLITNRISETVVLWEEESLCRNNEQLTVHDYFEAIERIKASMKKCTAFLYIDSPAITNGYFTSAEFLQWRRLHDNPCAYRIYEKGGKYFYNKVGLVPLTNREKRHIGIVSYLSSPDRLFDTEGGVFMDSWGKYAKDCFLVGCCVCGKYYLMTEKKLRFYAKSDPQNKIKAVCPYCNQKHATFSEVTFCKKFFGNRIPIIIHPAVKNVSDHVPLSVDDVIDLMNTNKLPERFALDKFPEEKLQSDFRKQMTTSIKTSALIIGVILLAGELYSLRGNK